MAVHTQTRIDRPLPHATAGRAPIRQGDDSEPRVLLRLPDFRARHRPSAAPSARSARDHFDGAPRPEDNRSSAKVRPAVSWRHWTTDAQGRSRLAWLGRVLAAAGRLAVVIWREPRLLMLLLSMFGLQAAGVMALLTMGSGPQPNVGPATAPVPALAVEPSPLLPLPSAAPAAAPGRPLQTPLSPPLPPQPAASPRPAPATIPPPTVREPVLPPMSPRLGDPHEKLPWEEWSNPSEKPSSAGAWNMSTDSGTANQPAALAGAPAGDALRPEYRTAARPKRAQLKGTIEKLKSPAGGERPLPGLY